MTKKKNLKLRKPQKGAFLLERIAQTDYFPKII